MMRQLFLLMLHHMRIPEFMWGGAVQSSKSSAEAQLPPFIQYIKYQRLQFEGQGADPVLGILASGGLLELVDVWLRMYKLLNPAIVLGTARVHWPEIDIQDNTLKFQWGQFLAMAGYINGEEALRMSSYFDDPAETFAQAQGNIKDLPDFDKFASQLKVEALNAARGEHHVEDEEQLFPFPFAPTTDVTMPGISNDDFSLVGPSTWWGGP
jgi:hypothetical protein